MVVSIFRNVKILSVLKGYDVVYFRREKEARYHGVQIYARLLVFARS